MLNLSFDPVVGFYSSLSVESKKLTKMEAMELMLAGFYVHANHRSGKWSRMTLNPGPTVDYEEEKFLDNKHFPQKEVLPVGWK